MLERIAENWWLLAVRGVAAIIFGILALIMPGITLFALVILYAAFAFTDGVFAIAAAVRNRRHERWGALALQGVLGVAVGILTVVWPGITALALLAVIAFWALFSGIIEIAAAVKLRKVMEGEWLLALSGVMSVLFGIGMIVCPGAGALAVVWIIGLYAIADGAILLWLGFKAREFARGRGVSAIGATG